METMNIEAGDDKKADSESLSKGIESSSGPPFTSNSSRTHILVPKTIMLGLVCLLQSLSDLVSSLVREWVIAALSFEMKTK